MPDRMRSILAKVERAKEYIGKLERNINAFWSSNVYTILPEDELETGDKVWRARGLFEAPIWTIGELVAAALEPSGVPPLPRPTPETTLRPGYQPFRPVVLQGEKMGTRTPR
jgi:hypothetical protein